MWVDLLSIRLINTFALKGTLRKRRPKLLTCMRTRRWTGVDGVAGGLAGEEWVTDHALGFIKYGVMRSAPKLCVADRLANRFRSFIPQAGRCFSLMLLNRRAETGLNTISMVRSRPYGGMGRIASKDKAYRSTRLFKFVRYPLALSPIPLKRYGPSSFVPADVAVAMIFRV